MPEQERQQVLQGMTHKVVTGCGNAYITVNFLDEKPFEVFCTLGKAGQCIQAQLEAITRLSTLGLRSGVKVEDVYRQLIGIRCNAAMPVVEGRVLSCADAIAQVLKNYLPPEAPDLSSAPPIIPVSSGEANVV